MYSITQRNDSRKILFAIKAIIANKPGKIQRLSEIWSHELCVTGTMLYHSSWAV